MRDWNKLLESGRVVELGPATAKEIAQRIHLARLAEIESRVPELSPGRRFQILYESAYRWSELVLRSEGWRTKGEGHHETLFSTLPHFLGVDAEKIARFLDRCRRRRNLVTYGSEYPTVTDSQVEELAKAVKELELLILKWLREKHPELIDS
jgi:hypothetical protein